MSTTVNPVALNYTYSESCDLVGETRGSSITKQIHGSITEYSRMVRRIGHTAFMTVAEFTGTPLNSGSDFDVDEVQYIRVTNLDTNHGLAIAFKPTTGTTMALEIPPGQTFMMGSPKGCFADSETVPFRDLSQIRLRALESHVDAEIVVAST